MRREFSTRELRLSINLHRADTLAASRQYVSNSALTTILKHLFLPSSFFTTLLDVDFYPQSNSPIFMGNG